MLKLVFNVIWKLIDFLVIIGPVLVELFKAQKKTLETAVDHVKEKQKDELKQIEAVLNQDSHTLSTMARTRLLVAGELIRRVREARRTSLNGKQIVLPKGPEVPSDNGK